VGYTETVTSTAKRLLAQALELPADERAELASVLLASLDGDADSGWEDSWLSELDRRVEAAEQRGESGSDWRAARARILAKLGA